MNSEEVAKKFRDLVENAERKFARVRDVPAYARAPNQYLHKVFKAYTRLWKFQQEKRSKLVEAGLHRWEIGEIASRIGQLYFGQYMRTSETRFLLESFIFYEAVLNRRYFEDSKQSKHLAVRFKELRFYARFLLVALLMNRYDVVHTLVQRFRSLVDDSQVSFGDTNFKEWRLVVFEIVRFLKVDKAFVKVKPLRYCTAYDSHPSSHTYISRFNAIRALKLTDAILTSYHPNEVKFAEFSLDVFRMLQCLEREPNITFYQKNTADSSDSSSGVEFSGTSGQIDINLASDMTDPSLPQNSRKIILYHPSVAHFITVLATVCEELSPDSVLLLYVSASGDTGSSDTSHAESSRGARRSANPEYSSHTNSRVCEHVNGSESGRRRDSAKNHVWLGPKGSGSKNKLYPADILTFTRAPIFFIVDSNSSHVFKALHGIEREETAALFLSPSRISSKDHSVLDVPHNGSQFSFFLTAPLQAFLQLIGNTSSFNEDAYNDADTIIFNAFSEWEVLLCTSSTLHLVWTQVFSDPFLRRLILRFILCRSVLFFFHPSEHREEYLPVCLPDLPNSVSANSTSIKNAVVQLVTHFRASESFHFDH